MNKYKFIAVIRYLLYKINLSLAYNRMELTPEEEDLVDTLVKL